MNTGADQKKIKDELVGYLQSKLELNNDELANFKDRCIPFMHDVVDKLIDTLKDFAVSLKISEKLKKKQKHLENQLYQQTKLQQEQKENILEIQSLTAKYSSKIKQFKNAVAVMMEGYYQSQAAVEDQLVNHVCSFYQAVEKQKNKPILKDEAQSQPAYSLKNIQQLEVIPPIREVLEEARQLSHMFGAYVVSISEQRRSLIRRCQWDLADFGDEEEIISEFTNITSTTESNLTQIIQSLKTTFANSNIDIFLGQ